MLGSVASLVLSVGCDEVVAEGTGSGLAVNTSSEDIFSADVARGEVVEEGRGDGMCLRGEEGASIEEMSDGRPRVGAAMGSGIIN